MKARIRNVSIALILAQIASLCQPALSQLSDSQFPPNLTPMRLTQPQAHRPLKAPEKQTLEDLFRRSDLKTSFVQPVDLSHTAIPGLTENAVSQLATNHFVMSNSNEYKKLSDVYVENRSEGKSNFVTVDSVLHPYFAFANGMLASSIEEYIHRDLKELLLAMVRSSIGDYRMTSDDEVKDDIQRNLAFLCVALRLLDPNGKQPDIGGALELANSDYLLVSTERKGKSNIFNRETDFSTFRPWGFMGQRDKLRRFALAYQWLSRMHFPLSNITNNTFEGGGNSFRRAVLLYRSLALAELPGGADPMERWNKIATVISITGFDPNAKRKTIIPPELAPLLSKSESDFNKLLKTLSEPFLRTKLLLTVRKQRPLELNARSVFEMGQGSDTTGDDLVFRMFPLTDPPELSWLRESAHSYVESTAGPDKVPLGLLSLHAHGAQQATNVLSEQLETLDTGLSKTVPRLERLVKVVSPEEAGMDRHWSIVSSLYRPYPDGVQLALRSETWLTRELQTALSAWIDSYCACRVIPTGGETASETAAVSQPAVVVTAATAGKAPTKPKGPARFHYLEPRLEVYKQLQHDCHSVVYQLTELKCFPQRYQQRAQDFQRLFQRLTAIAELETKSEPISASDFQLLANIDRVLGPVDSPLASNIYLDVIGEAPAGAAEQKPTVPIKDNMTVDQKLAAASAAKPRTGATIGVGRAAKIYVICNTSQGATLTRGGCYTYYEVQGGPIKDEHWERKLTYGMMMPPYWTRKFHVTKDQPKSKPLRFYKDESSGEYPGTGAPL